MSYNTSGGLRRPLSHTNTPQLGMQRHVLDAFQRLSDLPMPSIFIGPSRLTDRDRRRIRHKCNEVTAWDLTGNSGLAYEVLLLTCCVQEPVQADIGLPARAPCRGR
jgi:hypothetical protein